MTKLPNITISGAVLSDLFFNSNLLYYDAACEMSTRASENEDEPWQQRRDAGLMKDAKAFAELTGNQVTAQQLVEDFMARL